MTPEILVGTAVADALAKKGSTWTRSLGQLGSALMPPSLLAAEAGTTKRLCSPCGRLAESENGNAPSWRTLHRTR